MQDYSRYDRLTITVADRIAQVVLDRPEKMNAVDAAMHAELALVFSQLNLDCDVDFILLSGAGNNFSAGGDADWMVELIEVEGEWKRKGIESRQIWLSLLDLEKPIICKVRGAARGMCATIMSLCDVVIVAESATIADTHTMMGLAAADGCNAVWPFGVGFLKTKDLLFNSRVLSAREAETMGLVTQVVADDGLDEAVASYLRQLRTKPVRTLQLTKMAINFQMKQLVWPALESALNLLEISNFSPEHRAAVDQFMNRKRGSDKAVLSD